MMLIKSHATSSVIVIWNTSCACVSFCVCERACVRAYVFVCGLSTCVRERIFNVWA